MNSLYIKISGLNLTRLIDKLVQKGVCIDEVKIRGNTLKFKICERDLEILKSVCNKEHKIFKIYYKRGIKNLFFRLPYLIGSFVAILTSFLYLFSFNILVHSVNVEYVSNLDYDLTSVNRVLSDYGVKSGMKKSDVKTKELERLLIEKVDDLSGCTVKLEGSELKIFVYPSITQHEINKKDLCSKFDGVITKTEVAIGKCKFKKGDIVKKGDVVVESDDGAEGKVYANVYFTKTIIYNQKQIEKQKTEKYLTFRDYKIFSKKVTNVQKPHDFTKYLVEKCDFYVYNNFFIPIICEEFRYYEINLIEKIIPFSIVEEKIKKELYNEVIKQIGDKEDIKNVTYSIVSEGDYTRVDCYAECEIDILK